MDENSQDFSLEALRAGDRSELARVVEAYSGQIYRLAIKMLGTPQDAEDVLQNTFLKAIQHFPTFEGRSSISTWLYRIAANEALMILRKQKPEVPVPGEDEADEDDDYLPVQFVDWSSLPEAELISSEAHTYLDSAIQQLSEKLRMVFVLRDLEGLSIRETGEVLGLTETAVKTRLLRARLQLREQLSAYYRERLREERTQ
jgi:RNA polymerase sigma-70 factor (ECF subfamily)